MHTFVILFFTLAAFAVSWLLLVKKQLSLEKSILVAVLVFGFLNNVITVPGLVPDEPAHIQTAYRYANVMLGKDFIAEAEEGMELQPRNKPIQLRKADLPILGLSYFHGPSQGAYQLVRDGFEWFCSQEDTVMVSNLQARCADSGFIGYLFPALGIALGRILRLGMYPSLYLGRLMNLVFYAFCIYWTIRLAPFKKWLFALLSLTPMAMQFVCSFSYDTPLLGLSFLTIAWLFKLVYQADSLTWRDWMLTLVLAFLLIPCKFSICPFIPLLVIPASKCGGQLKKWGLIAAVLLVGIVGLIPQYADSITRHLGNVNQLSSNSQNARSVPLYTIGWILRNPKETVQILLHTIRQNFSFYWTHMLGGRIAAFVPVINWSLPLLVVLVLASMQDPADSYVLPVGHRLLHGSAFLIIFFKSMILMMFMYTPLGNEIIDGVQGRYFLPAIPLLCTFLGTGNISLTETAKRWLTALVFTCNAAIWIEILMWIRTYP